MYTIAMHKADMRMKAVMRTQGTLNCLGRDLERLHERLAAAAGDARMELQDKIKETEALIAEKSKRLVHYMTVRF